MTPTLHKHLVWASASLVFGLFLIYFGFRRHLFVPDGWRFPATVFAVVWLIVVALLGRYFRDNPPAGADRE